jgi:membrane peptidoglycan carboxypeptidase
MLLTAGSVAPGNRRASMMFRSDGHARRIVRDPMGATRSFRTVKYSQLLRGRPVSPRFSRITLGLALLTASVMPARAQQAALQGAQQPPRPPAPSEPWRIVPLPQSSLVFGRDGSLVGETGREWRTSVPLRSLPKYVGYAFIAVEDQRFYQHDGVDVIGVASAVKGKLFGERRGGASTITQQLVGNMHPEVIDRRDLSLGRKLREQQAAREMEKRYTKEQILEAYLNTINFGHGWYGVETAARHYFGKGASRLTLAEAALVAPLPKSNVY